MPHSSTPITYADAGVSIDSGNALVDHIKPLAKSTARSGVMGGIGGFGALFDVRAAGYHDPILVSSTDGVGTKLKVAQNANRHDTIGIDLVAMCVNDLLVQGAEPLFFLDYFATGKLHVTHGAAIIAGIAEGCRQAGCALIGGETAEMPGLYAGEDYDLAGFTVGAVERDCILPQPTLRAGDVILGLASSGVHSNGYSLVRHLVAHAGLGYAAPAPFAPEKTLGEALLTPTRIYVQSLLPVLHANGRDRLGPIKALSHITGGGLLENIPRVLPENLSAHLHASAWELPPVFTWLQTVGNMTNHELHRTFNCGIGMVAVVGKQDADTVAATLRAAGETVFVIGDLAERSGDAVVIG